MSTLATGDHTHGGYFMTHSVVQPGGAPPSHIHTRAEESFFLLGGELNFLVGASEIAINVPCGTKHRFRNHRDHPAELLFWFTPAGMEGLLREVARHPERIVEIGKTYGVQYFPDE